MKYPYVLFLVLLAACAAPADQESEAEASDLPEAYASLKEALLLYAPFDGSLEAAYATGDAQLYSAPTFADRFDPTPDLDANPNVALLPGQGKVGDALAFKAKGEPVAFYEAADNMAYDSTSWDVTVSFWLKLDPAQDLDPGYCDPIQISDVGYNDAGLWVDFTQENPRDFRLGIIGDLAHWNPENLGPNDTPEFEKRLINAGKGHFGRDRWTHVLFTAEALNAGGTVRFYLDGELVGTREQVEDPFTWEESRAKMVLGLNYVGLFDELMVFDKALSPQEVQQVYSLPEGGKELM